MRKAIFLLILLVGLLFPQSQTLAIDCPTGQKPLCADNTEPELADQKCPGPNRTKIEPTCKNANTPVTAIDAVKNANQQVNPPADPCPKGNTNCTSAKGIPCGGATGLRNGTGGIETAIGCIPTEPRALIEGLIRYGIMAAGGAAFLLMILAALQMITAEGNPQTIKGAQEKFYSAIIGLLLIIFSVLLMQVIGVDILNLPGFSK